MIFVKRCVLYSTNRKTRAAHTNGTMEEQNVIERSERRPSSTAIFFACLFAIVGLGTTIAYCSGIMNGVGHLEKVPFVVPDWLVIAIPPVVFLHQALALWLTLRQNVYTDNGRMVRTWTWIFQVTLFLMISFLPYFVFNGMPVAAYIVSTITCAVALGATILTYRQTVGGGVLMTILTAVLALVMIYLGYWAFA